ncbi:MAG: polysaccharide deacetylase family protein [Gammaproteobacteria bacterium]|nr:polysaccharide deacetylase family protein [Gammaproteobacteria bacterium]
MPFGIFVHLLAVLSLLAMPAAADHCVVVRYQHIDDDTPGVSSVTPQQFQQHLDYLLENDFSVLELEAVVTALRTGSGVPARCVALSIDGAFESAYEEAFPRTRRYGFPLTVFISSEAVDAGLDGQMTWQQMREMQAAGVSFQSLGHSHHHLVRRDTDESLDDWQQRVAFDIQLAQSRIEDELGTRPTLFAYPYGEYNEALQQLVESMGLTGFGTQAGALWPQADFTALPRFPLASFGAQPRPFAKKVNARPLPIAGAFPTDPVVPLDDWQPTLTLVFQPLAIDHPRLRCRLNGAPGMIYQWLEQPENAVVVSPRGRLRTGRNRVDCTLPLTDDGGLGWYSHLWIRRDDDGGWYREAYDPLRVSDPVADPVPAAPPVAAPAPVQVPDPTSAPMPAPPGQEFPAGSPVEPTTH